MADQHASASSTAESRDHHLRPMRGRDRHQPHRVATPLELLFDLTFVVAFGFAGNEAAHALSAGHVGAALTGFAFTMFAVCWAWINFSWFASAFDTDDWVYRLTTMLQMVGVLILALGIAPVFASLQTPGAPFDNAVLVLGYVVMRVAMVLQWLRVAWQDPAHRRAALTFASFIAAAQLGWAALLLLDLPFGLMFPLACICYAIELLGPVVAERRNPTPWHPHHIAERYSLLAIITLGEVVVGTTAALGAAVAADGWDWQAAVTGLAGVGLAFAMWWMYFMLPSAEVLHRLGNRKAFGWGYGHIFLFAAIAATGAGLHVAANYLAAHGAAAAHGQFALSETATLACVAVPVATYIATLYALYTWLLGVPDRLHLVLLSLGAIFVAASVWMASLGVPVPLCLLVLLLAPVATVIGYERSGHRHQASALAALEPLPNGNRT